MDRWSQLSMSEKSDLMSLYIRNGISSLEEIKKHYNSFADGGSVEDKEDNPPVDAISGAARPIPNKWDVNNKAAWFQWWYNNRKPQLNNLIEPPIVQFFTGNDRFKSKKQVDEWINFIPKTLDSYTETSTYPSKLHDIGLINPESKASMSIVNADFPTAEHATTRNEAVNNANTLRFIGRHGETSNALHHINYYNRPDEDITGTVIHERTHAIVPEGLFSTHPILTEIYNKEFTEPSMSYPKPKGYLRDGVEGERYLDSANEIYSRLMNFRFTNKINPKHKWTLDEIKKWREKGKFKGWEFNLDRYNDEFLLHLFNDVAQNNTTDNTVNYAALGGHLYQDGGPIKKESNYSVGRVLDRIYRAVNHEEFMGEPSHKYQFIKPEYVGLSEEELDSLVGQADERGHRLDVVKAEAHPSHYSRGTWSGNDFELTDKGLAEVNHTYFGLNDGGQDPQARLTYKGSTVLPEITITPDGAYIYNTYDNIKLHLKQQGGSLGKVTPLGQWQYPHQITTVPSNNITMKGVDYPVLGISDTGDTKYMLPNMDYLFDGNYVTEYPVHKMQKGGYANEPNFVGGATSVNPNYQVWEDLANRYPIEANKPSWHQGLTDYDWARARQYYSNPDGTLTNQGIEFLKNISSKRTTGQSNYMRDVNKLSYIPNAAVGAIGAIPIAAGLIASAPVVAEAAAPYVVPAVKSMFGIKNLAGLGLSMGVATGVDQTISDNSDYKSLPDWANQTFFDGSPETEQALEFFRPEYMFAPYTSKVVNKGIGLINNAANTVRSFGSPILSQSTPNTLTRVIGSGTTGLEDAILTAGYLRGNPNGGITTAKNLNRRYLPKLKQAGASQGLYDRFASNALTEKDYEWLHKNMPENWFIDSTPAEEGIISLKRGMLPQTYEEYLQMYRSKNPQRTNVDIRTGEGLTSEDIAYNWAGENEPTFAVSKDIAKEMGYDYENILNNSLFRGDYAVQIKNARTHGVSGNNFPTGAHLDEHWSLKYPMEWNNPDVSFYKAHNIPLFNKKVYTRINPVKELGLDQTVQKARNARIEVPEVLSAREPFEMSNIPNWREIFSNYNPNAARTVRTTTQSTEFNPDIFNFNKGNTDTRFEFFEPWNFINYDLTKMSTDEVVKTFGPKAKHLKELYDVAAANNFEGKYADIAKDVELKLSKMFAIDPKDVDIAAGLARAKGIYNIPEYTERFKKYGDLGETFIQDAKNRLDNIQLQGVSRNYKVTGQYGLKGSASTTPHPTHPTITLSNNNSSSNIREFTTHEANHAAHGTKYQPKWMEVHNEKIRPVPKKNRKDFTDFDKYLDEMDELVERSKTAVEYAHETRLEGETLDQALDRVFEAANKDVYNSEIPSDIRQMVKNYTKDSVLKFWKQFLGGIALPTYISTRNEG